MAHLGLKPHVEHAVRLIKHQEGHTQHVARLHLDQVDHAPRGADGHLQEQKRQCGSPYGTLLPSSDAFKQCRNSDSGSELNAFKMLSGDLLALLQGEHPTRESTQMPAQTSQHTSAV